MDDLDEVLAVDAASWDGGFWTRAMYTAELQKPHTTALGKFEAGSLLGYVFLERILDEGSLLLIAIAPQARRKVCSRSASRCAPGGQGLTGGLKSCCESGYRRLEKRCEAISGGHGRVINTGLLCLWGSADSEKSAKICVPPSEQLPCL